MQSKRTFPWKQILVLSLAIFSLGSANAQIEIDAPYNPDWDENDQVGTTDLLQLLTIFGFDFEADPLLLDGVAFEEVIAEILSSLDSLQSATANPCPDPCNGLTSVDWQGETYEVVPVGCDCWFAENLRAVQFANGDSIPKHYVWEQPSTDVWYTDPLGSLLDAELYGRGYSVGVVADARGICPVGWRVPTRQDVMDLTSVAGGIETAANQLAAPTIAGSGLPAWNAERVQAVDAFGLSLTPVRGLSESNYGYVAQHWWMLNTATNAAKFGIDEYAGLYGATQVNTLSPWQVTAYYSNTSIVPVRCVLGPRIGEGCTTPGYLEYSMQATIDDGSCLTPVVAGCLDPEAGNFDPEANVDAGNCVAAGESSACDGASSITYLDEVYSLVELAGGCWFGENLRASHFSNGDAIDLIEPFNGSAYWTAESPGPAGGPHPEPVTAAGYDFGWVYNFEAAQDPRGLCPTGWHKSSAADWNELAGFLGGMGAFKDALRTPPFTTSGGTNIWNSRGGGLDLYGFSMLPNLNFHGLLWGDDTILYTSTDSGYTDILLEYGVYSFFQGGVRCVKD